MNPLSQQPGEDCRPVRAHWGLNDTEDDDDDDDDDDFIYPDPSPNGDMQVTTTF
jgi:hypothetical protein